MAKMYKLINLKNKVKLNGNELLGRLLEEYKLKGRQENTYKTQDLMELKPVVELYTNEQLLFCYFYSATF